MITLLRIAAAFAMMATVAVADDADTLTVNGTRYRLDGIDAPELDQRCLDADGKTWACGRVAHERLVAFIAGRPVVCADLGEDAVYGNRRIGRCSAGETDLNRWLVREGLAINFEPYAKGRFVADQDNARTNNRGFWAGCFVAPTDFRHWRKHNAALHGAACQKDARPLLFPDHPEMPPGCEIKGSFSLQAAPSRGIYHLPGCKSYQRLANPQRWFCSEDDARAADFRRAFNCPR